MFASDLISTMIKTISLSDTAQKANDRLNEAKLKHLPILNKKQYVGLLHDEDVMNLPNMDIPLKDLSLQLIHPFVYEQAHGFDVIKIFSDLKLTSLPVLNQQHTYMGLITSEKLLHTVGEIYAVREAGGIIVLEISNRDNSLAHISQIIEANNAQILSSIVHSFEDSTRLRITLKINKTELTSIVASLERYKYQVNEVYNNTQIDDGTRDRYDSLMAYLNI